MRRFAFRWHPFAIDPAVDYSQEEMTLVEFLLEEGDGGTLLTIRESGFDRVPLARRAAAFAANDGGRSEEHTSELQSLMRTSYADFCLKKNYEYHSALRSVDVSDT